MATDPEETTLLTKDDDASIDTVQQCTDILEKKKEIDPKQEKTEVKPPKNGHINDTISSSQEMQNKDNAENMEHEVADTHLIKDEEETLLTTEKNGHRNGTSTISNHNKVQQSKSQQRKDEEETLLTTEKNGHRNGTNSISNENQVDNKEKKLESSRWNCQTWLDSFSIKTNIMNEVKSGLFVGFEQVGQSIAFALMIGVGPQAGLHAAWIIGLCSLIASRPGIINSSTGLQAAILAPYIKELGVGYLSYIVMFMSAFQTFFGLIHIEKLIHLVPHTVMIGFFNGLALTLAIGQIGNFQDGNDWLPYHTIGTMWFLIGVTVIIVVILKKFSFTKSIPPMFSGILIITVISEITNWKSPTVGHVSKNLSVGLPTIFSIDPQYTEGIPSFNWVLIKKCVGPAFIAAAASTIECVFTMDAVTDFTESENDSATQQFYAISFGNLISGLFGTMGGGASFKLSMKNCTNGVNGKLRISQLIASITVFMFAVALEAFVRIIPIASIVAVMIIWCFTMFQWKSLQIIFATFLPQRLRDYKIDWFNIKVNRFDALTIILVTFVSLWQNLFLAILFGVLVTSIIYAWESGKEIGVDVSFKKNGTKVYRVKGPLFFGSFQNFVKLFTVEKDPQKIEIDFSSDAAQLYDYSAFYGLRNLADKYKALDKSMTVTGLDKKSKRRVTKARSLADFDFAVNGEVVDGGGGAEEMVALVDSVEVNIKD